MKARALRRVLEKHPLSYAANTTSGSHTKMTSATYPDLLFAFHDGDTVPPHLVKKILVKDVGLTVDEARALL